MIISGKKIQEIVKKENLIENFLEKNIGGSGYDLRVGKIYRIKSTGFIGAGKQINSEAEEITELEYALKPNEYVLIETLEKVNMPKNLAARILPRSSVFRLGCALITAFVDPGFRGTLTMGLKNLSDRNFKFEKGARIAQILFEEVSGDVTLYKGRYQGGKVV